MGAVTRWHLIRHAPVTGPMDRIYGAGERDADVSDRECFAALAAALPAGAVWITSHLRRTTQTARAIQAAGRPPAETITDRRLGEQSFGEWQGRRFADLHADGSMGWHRFWLAPADHAPPGGESFTAVIARVRRALEEHSATRRGRDLVCVAHGGSIRAALAVALDLAPERALAFAVENCSLTRIAWHHGEDGRPGAWAVDAVNTRPGRG